MDGLLKSLPPRALNEVLDVFEANLPDELLELVVDQPYIQDLLDQVPCASFAADR